MAAAGEAHISCSKSDTFAADAVCAALDALQGARVVAIHFSRIDGIPASALSHHPSLRRLEFIDHAMPPLRNLAGYRQLHGLRELVYRVENADEDLMPDAPSYQLQHAQPLSQLEVLDVQGMRTAGAETTLAALPRLRELNLDSSDLRTLPASMASLTRLTSLVLSWTEVEGGWQHLPPQLELLMLGWSRLSAVLPELSRLSRLTGLDLTGNDELEGGSLQVLGRLSSLRKLSLCFCHLGDAGMGLALPTTLERLLLAHDRLTAVPAALAPLTGLTGLYLCRNQMAGGWQHLAGMQHLAHLSVSSCSLSAVPQVLSQLTALTSLDMRDNPIASGWQHLADLHQLESLGVEECSMMAVPEVLSQLTALTHLDMTKNPIAGGWEHLSLLPLRYVLTDDPAHAINRF